MQADFLPAELSGKPLFCKNAGNFGTSLVVQQLRFCASNARSKGLIPGQRTKVPCATRCGQKKHKKTKKQKTSQPIFPHGRQQTQKETVRTLVAFENDVKNELFSFPGDFPGTSFPYIQHPFLSLSFSPSTFSSQNFWERR